MNYIPKIIHLVWFGGDVFSDNMKKCIDSWRKYCPDYLIMSWNENNCDLHENDFIKEASGVRKWAFVSDYIRLKVLYEYGGIYLDTDVEIIRPFDELLTDKHVVSGYASANMISTGFLAAEKGNVWIKALMEYYSNRHFVLENNVFDTKINNLVIAEVSKRFGFVPGDLFIDYGGVTLMTRDYFQPYTKYSMNWNLERIEDIRKYYKISKNTYCIHYCAASWEENKGMFSRIKHIVRLVFPQLLIEKLERIYYWNKKWMV